MAGSVGGAKLPRMRQMLQTIVIPQLTYACLVWYTPHGEKRHNKTHLRHLTSAQYQANRIITAAYRATSAPALDIETYTVPVKQKLDWLTSNAMLRIVSSPAYAKIVDSRPKGTQPPSKRAAKEETLSIVLYRWKRHKRENWCGSSWAYHQLKCFSRPLRLIYSILWRTLWYFPCHGNVP